MSEPAIPDFVTDDLHKLEVKLPDGALASLARYLDLLLETNQQFNLTAIRDRNEAWRRHIIDSLTLLPFIEEIDPGSRVMDVGSGGGLPGVPVAIARPDLQVTMLEATGKKAAFLSRCAKEIPLPKVSVIADRAEKAGQNKQYRERFDVVTCRAVGAMAELLEYTLPFLKEGGVLLAMKGPSVEQELEEAGDAMTMLGAGEFQVIDAYPEGFGQNTVIVQMIKDRPTPPTYPRLPGMPKQQPIGHEPRK